MDKYIRKIKINKVLTAIDTTGDGVNDTLAFINKDDKYVPLLIRQTFEDIGIYTDFKEKAEEIDFGNFWDMSNDGSNDGGTIVINSGVTNPYGDPNSDNGSETTISASTFEITGCMDPNALNYNSGATQPCQNCCDTGTTYTNINDDDGITNQPTNASGCYRLETGFFLASQGQQNYQNYVTNGQAEIQAMEWCKAIHPSCSSVSPQPPNTYPIESNCAPNGCGGNACCPGPPNTYHLLTSFECFQTGANCSGTYNNGCNCSGGANYLFGGIKFIFVQQTINGDLHYNFLWRFYCIPD